MRAVVIVIIVILIIAVAPAALLLVAGRLGWLRGRAAAELGVRDGRLAAPSRTDNSASSQADLYTGTGAAYARVEPLRFPGGADDALARMRRIVEAQHGAVVVDARPDYLYAQFTTPWLNFVDDVEFYAPPGGQLLHVRSASRVGRKDFGVNRRRVELLRRLFDAG